jgi:hypothetical protein
VDGGERVVAIARHAGMEEGDGGPAGSNTSSCCCFRCCCCCFFGCTGSGRLTQAFMSCSCTATTSFSAPLFFLLRPAQPPTPADFGRALTASPAACGTAAARPVDCKLVEAMTLPVGEGILPTACSLASAAAWGSARFEAGVHRAGDFELSSMAVAWVKLAMW